jgi:hypothetical protein
MRTGLRQRSQDVIRDRQNKIYLEKRNEVVVTRKDRIDNEERKA